MTEFPISGTAKPMGRPPLNNKPTLVRISQEDLDRIDALEGQNQRARFIREAVEAELARREGEVIAGSAKPREDQ